MPLIQVNMLEGRTEEQKRQLLHAISDAVRDTLDLPEEAIRVWIYDMPMNQFISGGMVAADRYAPQTAGAPGS